MISLDCLLEKWQFENNNNMSEQSFQKETYSLLYHPQSSYIPYAYLSKKRQTKPSPSIFIQQTPQPKV